MKRVMQQFVDRTTQRFHEYDERMKTTRQKCKEQCDKEIQKIILKDKLEKELMDKFATLQTDIQNDAIPTCICEKSMADIVEKTCLKCTQNLGGIVAPSSGVLLGIAEGALYAWKPTALEAAIAKAITAGATEIAAAGLKAGHLAGTNAVIEQLQALAVYNVTNKPLELIIGSKNNTALTMISNIIKIKNHEFCGWKSTVPDYICKNFSVELGTLKPDGSAGLPDNIAIPLKAQEILTEAKGAAAKAAKNASESVSTAITEKETVLFEAGFNSSISSINAAIIAIVVIILVMVIIYKILRYRRKKKMKKKLQYIKLLNQ
ncbi:hypothetical protein PFNF135_00975 [Plasmodium falciparum NF135/5.C10]|uniref:Surface antigen n=1 Tax=Plasmodium falciparum NF135/5.C10 TaxID=1036726 RepID=W4IL31_PLAFA|nr:hypothetical protein PFNF135_00975 [Plasmodium falciparum NF135/5.C10]